MRRMNISILHRGKLNGKVKITYNAFSDLHLLDVLFRAVTMRTIDHQPRCQSSLGQLVGAGLDVFRGVVGSLGGTSEDDMGEGVALYSAMD